MKNLPSFCLLVGYSGYSALRVPYILFKLEEIKKSEVVSLREHTIKVVWTLMYSHPFSLFNYQIYWYLKLLSQRTFLLLCKHRRTPSIRKEHKELIIFQRLLCVLCGLALFSLRLIPLKNLPTFVYDLSPEFYLLDRQKKMEILFPDGVY